ncbi:hypothetical protein [uncultured Mycobacterium sp.]|uniref:hypothetical protein n=1 Tax=uncultured Mycobacterium sp. TaxID=171292 RepID=UPI0035CB8E14
MPGPSSAQNNQFVTRMPSRWLRRDSGKARIERGTPRWIVGLAILVAGLILLASVFLDWGHITIGDRSNSIAQISVSGAGGVSVTMPQDDPEFERYAAKSLEHVVSHRGLWVAVIAVLVIAAGAAYLWLLPREQAAVGVVVLSGIASAFCMSCAFNLRRIFGEAFDVNVGHYSLGIGLVMACCTTIGLIALGVAALVLERGTAE